MTTSSQPVHTPGRVYPYASLLLSLREQLARLRAYNPQFWGGQLTEAQLDAVDTTSDHTQSVEDLEVLYVDFGSPEANLELWWRVLAGTQPDSHRWSTLVSGQMNLRLAGCARQYEPGIHKIRINLVAHWEPVSGRSVNQVRVLAKTNGETLAHAEALAAYGLHDRLLREQDGDMFPHTTLAGWQDVMRFQWYLYGRRVILWPGGASTLSCSSAVPVIIPES